uniref:Uncharacterized protein n=1 Tax=Nelumbo nucifera TaxID=4432 RepID=A0A822Z0G9_NELNU|nr:TPA_asm: hypothetical protein HUJ06_007630 [Nelumbo nucifera]
MILVSLYEVEPSAYKTKEGGISRIMKKLINPNIDFSSSNRFVFVVTKRY